MGLLFFGFISFLLFFIEILVLVFIVIIFVKIVMFFIVVVDLSVEREFMWNWDVVIMKFCLLYVRDDL